MLLKGPNGEHEPNTWRNVSVLVVVFGPQTVHVLTSISHCIYWWRRSCWLAATSRQPLRTSLRRGVLFSYMIVRNLLDLCLYELAFVSGVRQGASFSQCFQGTCRSSFFQTCSYSYRTISFGLIYYDL